MSLPAETAVGTDAAIITRMLRPDRADLPEDVAAAVLAIFRLDRADQDRLHELLARNQDGDLAPAERAEMESYLRISLPVDLMHAKARSSLRPRT